MSKAGTLYSLSTLKGTWTAPKLKRAGFTESQIRAGIRMNVLRENTLGVITPVPGKTKLFESELQPGQTVVKMVDGVPVKMMVVKDENGQIQLVNPSEPNSAQEVSDRKDLLTQDETEQLPTNQTPL